jgi:mannose-1-phosphate guanylyltransferase
MNLVVVIMAGGVGTRFWPLSTDEKPKQFLNLFGQRTLLQKSYDRIADLVAPGRIFVLTGKAFTSLVKKQLPEIPPENIIGEPLRRNTAAAVCLAALLSRKRFGNPVIATLTADHVIEPVDLFQRTLLSAVRRAAEAGGLHTFGIEPTFPATGYGYLERGVRITEDDGIEHFALLRFKEKPGIDEAREYVASGRFYWNAGMFVWTADDVLKELEEHLPGHVIALSKAVPLHGTTLWDQALKEAFEVLQPVSVDYGVMEKARNVCCVASTFSWHDVGGWLALENFLPEDKSGNRCRGEVLTLKATDNVVFCEDPAETVVLIGVKDLVVARSGSTTLITRKDREEDLKTVVESMGKK